MKEMVNAFSEYARAPRFEMTSVDLNELVREVADLYRAQEDAAGACELDVSVDPALGSDRRGPGTAAAAAAQSADQRRRGARRQARTARSCSRRSSRARTPTRWPRSRSRTTARDSSATLIAQVFDPYVTTKAKGTGLGLAIVRKIVEEHGGHIEAENRVEGGARIRIDLPVDRGAHDSCARERGERRTEPRRERA